MRASPGRPLDRDDSRIGWSSESRSHGVKRILDLHLIENDSLTIRRPLRRACKFARRRQSPHVRTVSAHYINAGGMHLCKSFSVKPSHGGVAVRDRKSVV